MIKPATLKENNEYLAKKGSGYTFDDLCMIIELLRAEGGCPWDREQTHKSIRKDLIEETYEVIEAIDNGDPALMKEELGDLLQQVVFHAQIEKESGYSDITGVANDICVKLIHRHPHVFGNVRADTSDEVLANWDRIKTEEKHRDTISAKLRSVPPCLPALMRAQKVGKRAACFDFPDAEAVMIRLGEETDELREAVASGESERIADEMGDVLFTAVSIARKLGVDSEEALTRATDKFIGRFTRMEEAAAAMGKEPAEMSQEELDMLWDKVKSRPDKM